MPLVVFLRGVNVGGHKAFQPSALARQLGRLDVQSVGAAGTFIVRGNVGSRVARTEFSRHLPFDAHVMICPAAELVDLVRQDPFPERVLGDDVKGFVSVLEHRPRGAPQLPIRQPEGKNWQVTVIAVRGRFAVSLHRKTAGALVYPNEVVERRLRVVATTRSWNTIVKLYHALEPRR